MYKLWNIKYYYDIYIHYHIISKWLFLSLWDNSLDLVLFVYFFFTFIFCLRQRRKKRMRWRWDFKRGDSLFCLYEESACYRIRRKRDPYLKYWSKIIIIIFVFSKARISVWYIYKCVTSLRNIYNSYLIYVDEIK